MRKTITLFLAALILIPFTAFAEHHRQHATDFLNQASDELLIVQGQMSYYSKVYVPGSGINETNEQILHKVDTVSKALNNATNLIVEALANLATPTGESLDLARRAISRPRHEVPDAALSEAWKSIYYMNVIIWSTPDEAPGTIVLLGALSHLTVAWRHLDNASWHINDAIREEIYNDPAFQ